MLSLLLDGKLCKRRARTNCLGFRGSKQGTMTMKMGNLTSRSLTSIFGVGLVTTENASFKSLHYHYLLCIYQTVDKPTYIKENPTLNRFELWPQTLQHDTLMLRKFFKSDSSCYYLQGLKSILNEHYSYFYDHAFSQHFFFELIHTEDSGSKSDYAYLG